MSSFTPLQSAEAIASSSKTKLDSTTFRALHPRRYLKEWLDQGFRPEKRPRRVDGWRDVGINVGAVATSSGSSLVRLGDTTIICGIKAEIATPTWDNPDRGWIVPNLDLPALCSPNFKPGPPADEAQVMSQRLADLLGSTSPLPLTALSIHPSKSAWVLYVDLVCINYDGNAFDAAVLAMMVALRQTRLPKAKYDPETGLTTCSRLEERRLGDEMVAMPLTCGFGLFDNQYILPDPTSFEAPLLSTEITVAYDILPLLPLLPPMATSTATATDRHPAGPTKASPLSSTLSDLKLKLVRQTGIGGLKGRSGIEVLGDCLEMGRSRCAQLAGIIAEASK